MLNITRIAAEQSEETKQEKNFSKAAGENFEWCGKGAAILALTCDESSEGLRKIVPVDSF